MRPRPPDEKQAALDLFVEVGVREASRRTGIDKGLISKWAKVAGLVSRVGWQTQAATEASAAKAERIRSDLRLKWLEKALDLLNRMDEPHVEFKGARADEVTYPKATASDCRAYAFAAAILIDKYRLEVGEVTSRDESHVHSHDRSALDDEISGLLEEMATREKGRAEGEAARTAGETD
jgi:hypothetical protein